MTKVHHCLVDGMSGVSVTNLMLDPSPAPSPREDDPAERLPGPPQRGAVTAARQRWRGERAPGIDLALHPGKVRDALGSARAGRVHRARRGDPAPHTSLNVPIGGNRRMRSWRRRSPT